MVRPSPPCRRAFSPLLLVILISLTLAVKRLPAVPPRPCPPVAPRSAPERLAARPVPPPDRPCTCHGCWSYRSRPYRSRRSRSPCAPSHSPSSSPSPRREPRVGFRSAEVGVRKTHRGLDLDRFLRHGDRRAKADDRDDRRDENEWLLHDSPFSGAVSVAYHYEWAESSQWVGYRPSEIPAAVRSGGRHRSHRPPAARSPSGRPQRPAYGRAG